MPGHQTSRHQWSVGHGFLSTLQWHYKALASENCHPVVPRWPFHLWHCRWRAWNHSGSTSGRRCWLVILACSCMPTSVSASWWSECLSAFSDLLACSMVLESWWQWLLLPFWIFCSLRVLQFHDPIAFPKSLILLSIRNCKKNKPSPKIKGRN